MKHFVILFLLIMPPLSTLRTMGESRYNYTPKSPEAAAFDRVPDIPASNYTGSMSFSIPIYEST